ncbi:MAG: hypothetical protein J6W26_00740 [Bacteroidales bacterium]|nr:hypothetical protein [Bacteroidales bacterium]
MKKALFLFILCLTLGFLNAQQHYQFRTDTKSGLQLISSTADGLKLHYTLSEIDIAAIDNGEEKGQEIVLKGCFGSSAEGMPNLPVENRYIAVPHGAAVSITVTTNASKTLSGIDLLPAAAPQGNTEPDLPVLHKDPTVYHKNAFFPAQQAALSDVSKIRNLDVVMLSLSPIRYNPVRKTLEVAYDMDIEIRFEGGDGTFGEARYRNPDWDNILRNLVINGDMLPEAHYYDLVNQAIRDGEEGCEYLIIAPDDESILPWADTLKNFRMRQGVLTKVVTTSECGGNDPDAIWNYVYNAYENWAIPPAAVLLFGDYLHDNPNSINPYIYNLVSWQGYYYDYVTDNPIVDMNGDSAPDIAMTRMTVTTPEEYQHQVEKIIRYELTPPMDPLYYDHPVITSGYQHNTWFMFTSQSANGFFRNKLGKHPTNLYMVYDQENPLPTPPQSLWSTAYNTQAALDYFGPSGENYIPQSIGDLDEWMDRMDNRPLIEALEKGSFLTLFRDHSYDAGWACPAFDNRELIQVKLKDPTFVLSIGCLCADFTLHGAVTGVYSDCFNSKFNKLDAGSIGSIGASAGTYTQHNDLLAWGFLDYIFPEFMSTLGSSTAPLFARPSYALLAAKLFLKEQVFIPYTEQPAFADRTMHLFNHLGEGYLSLFTEVPSPITYTAIPFHFGDQGQYTFTAEEGSLVCFSTDDEILAVALADGTPQSVTLPLMEEGTRFTMTLTKQNGLRTATEITAIESGHPYVYVDDFTIRDYDGNGQPDYGEVISLNLSLHNIGQLPSEGGSITLLNDSPYYEVVEGNASYPAVDIDSHVALTDALTFRLAENVPDQTNVPLMVRFTDGGRSHEHTVTIVVTAPNITINPDFDYSCSGFPSTHISANGTTKITLSVKNTGHSKSQPLQAFMNLKAPFVTASPSQPTAVGLEPGEQTNLIVTTVANENEGSNTWLQSQTEIRYGSYRSTLDNIVQFGCIFEGFETSAPAVQMSNHSTTSWFYDDTDAVEGERCFAVNNITGTSTLMMGTNGDINIPSAMSLFYKNKTADTLNVIYRDPNGSSQLTVPLIGNDSWQYLEIPVQVNKQARFSLKINDSNGIGNYAKIDNVCFPSRFNPVACAGDILVSCGSTPVDITTAYAYNCQSVLWTTSGDGTFEPEDAVMTTYTPGNQDVVNGTVLLTLRASNNNAMHEHSTPLLLGNIPSTNIQGEEMVNLSLNPVSHYSILPIDGASYQWSLIPAKAGDIQKNGNEVNIVWNTTEEVAFALLTVTIENECASRTLRKNVLLSGYSIPEWDASIPAEAYLYNLLGELICTFNTTHSDIDKIMIPRDIHLPSSIYILKLNTPNGSISKKILIQ